MASGSGSIYPPVLDDLGALALKWDRRPRPWPWDITVDLTCIADAAPNTFGARIQVMAAGSYDFGDATQPQGCNMVCIEQITVEAMSANDKYILMFESSSDNVVFTPLGAIRFARTAAAPPTFSLWIPTVPMDIDANTMYASIKSRLGTSTVTFSIGVARHLEVHNPIRESTGLFPTG